MSDVQAALDAMTAAEHEGQALLEGPIGAFGVFIRDQARLIARDRETLRRHRKTWTGPYCVRCHDEYNRSEPMPCPDAQAVIAYWTEEA